MNHPYAYIGCFLEPDALLRAVAGVTSGHLSRVISAPHVTFDYQPEAVDESLFGKPLRLTARGYGNDGENEGLLVTLEADDPRLAEMIGAIDVPHITLSVSETGKPVNTRYLTFSPIDPIRLTAVFGGYTTDHRVVTQRP